jgi:type II secretory pathway component PulF
MGFIDDNVASGIAVLAMMLIAGGIIAGILYALHFMLTLPMRRAERARLFLDIIEIALDRGRPVEQELIFISQRRGKVLGGDFAPLANCLQRGMRLDEAIASVPQLLPPQVMAMLKAGQKIGDLKKVLPACRQMLRDAVSQTRGATNYLVVIAFVITPILLVLFSFISVKVLPVFHAISDSMAIPQSGRLEFLTLHRFAFAGLLAMPVGILWIAAFLYAIGPRAEAWFPVLQLIRFRMPWRRKRMQRDFSVMLAILLDAGMPEPEAMTLAAECTANKIFRTRAASTVAALQRGLKLPEAVEAMDDAGEFHWRLTNACHAHGGFLKALAGWHEALDAKAFQQEQAAAHGVTTALVLFNGLFVGFIVTTVFSVLVSILNAGVLW